MAEKHRAAGLPVPILVVGALVLIACTVGLFVIRQARNRPRDVPVLTQEAAAYLRSLQLEDVDMELAENYLKQTAATITGKITNNGSRTVGLVEINCVFRDPAGQVLLRERTAIIGRKTGPAAPGQTRSFELTFDNIPQGWNQLMPDLVISQIVFQE
ncbi:MAG: hypothetical protein HY238_27855 [Acidobacteria bacterium]|nr:hypothetical protein [Acidobacteriota bacterium]